MTELCANPECGHPKDRHVQDGGILRCIGFFPVRGCFCACTKFAPPAPAPNEPREVEWPTTPEYIASLQRQLAAARAEGLAAVGAALERAANVIDEEIVLRLQHDEHMLSIGELAKQIRALIPAGAIEALAQHDVKLRQQWEAERDSK